MPPQPRTAEQVATFVGPVMACEVASAERLPVGYGNENWRLVMSSGARYIAKFGPRSSESKWRSSQEAHRLAATVGVPVAQLIHFEPFEDCVLRVFAWIDGKCPTTIATNHAATARFFSELGHAVGALHSLERDAFSSRLDSSAPSFDRWVDYVEHRLGQICARCRAANAFTNRDLDRVARIVRASAARVSDVAEPTVCHRDLHGDNLLVGQNGELAAILDFDQAEVWDAAGEWTKLEWMLFPTFPASSTRMFSAAYRSVHPEPARWEDRKFLVDLMETVNGIANAVADGWDEFEADARSRLASLIR
jgi:Ser/Thr protein kinase RdoA (MazF antagonist)